MNVERRGDIKQPCSAPNCDAGGGAGSKAKPFTIDKWDVYRAWELVKANKGAARY